MRWLIVLPFARPGLMGMDFRDELVAMGHEVRTFAYRRDNPLYKNRSTKATYQIFILRRLERACLAWRPDLVLVIKGGPVTPGLIRRVKARLDTRFTAGADTEFRNDHYGLTFVYDEDDYWIGHSCNTAVAEWLRELDCDVPIVALSADYDVRPPASSEPEPELPESRP